MPEWVRNKQKRLEKIRAANTSGAQKATGVVAQMLLFAPADAGRAGAIRRSKENLDE
jgi:hypothetical protein